MSKSEFPVDIQIRDVVRVTLPKGELSKGQQQVLGWIMEHASAKDVKGESLCTKQS